MSKPPVFLKWKRKQASRGGSMVTEERNGVNGIRRIAREDGLRGRVGREGEVTHERAQLHE